jgi:hypothetical protein
MRVDMRDQQAIRDQVHAGLSALRVQGRQIWGESGRPSLDWVAVRLMVGVGDLARLARGGEPGVSSYQEKSGVLNVSTVARDEYRHELKKELGNIIFSTIRWIDDLGLDVLECLDLAIEAQEKFAKSGRPR